MRPAFAFLAIVVAFGVGLLSASLIGPPTAEQSAAPRRAPWQGGLKTAYTAIDVTEIPAPHVENSSGGALARLGGRLLLLTADGALHLLRTDRSGFRRIDAPAPFDRSAGQALFERQKDKDAVGAEGLAVRRIPAGWEIFVSHTRPHPGESCIGLAVSRMVLRDEGGELAAEDAWRQLFETSPCLPAPQSFPFQSAGMLAFAADGRLLLAVGDHGYDDFNRTSVLAKVGEDTNDYGKVLAIDPETGAAERVAKGFRNASGLAVDDGGRIWQVEHGPQGGDELNLITSGEDYGWPRVSYGVHYGSNVWPPNPAQGRHQGYRRPIYSWVPSIAVSGLIQIREDVFPAWRGDLLAGGLRGAALMRLRIGQGPRVIVAERIYLGARIRALAELASGEIAVLVDTAPVMLVLSPGEIAHPGERLARVLSTCTRCHSLTPGQNHSGTPTLHGVWQREVGAIPDADYSPALRAEGGVWGRERLAAYLRDPDATIPGTTMPSPGLGPEEIDDVVGALEKLN